MVGGDEAGEPGLSASGDGTFTIKAAPRGRSGAPLRRGQAPGKKCSAFPLVPAEAGGLSPVLGDFSLTARGTRIPPPFPGASAGRQREADGFGVRGRARGAGAWRGTFQILAEPARGRGAARNGAESVWLSVAAVLRAARGGCAASKVPPRFSPALLPRGALELFPGISGSLRPWLSCGPALAHRLPVQRALCRESDVATFANHPFPLGLRVPSG